MSESSQRARSGRGIGYNLRNVRDNCERTIFRGGGCRGGGISECGEALPAVPYDMQFILVTAPLERLPGGVATADSSFWSKLELQDDRS